jgi:hypothetical protein
MRKAILTSFATVLVFATSLAFARDPIHDGRLEVKPAKDDHFEAAEYTLGKAELYGYISDLKETKKITGILLLRGDKATTNQKHLIAISAKALSIEAFIDLDGKVQTLTDPTPSPDTAPPAIDNAGAVPATPATPATSAPPATPATPAPAATPTPAATTPATTEGGH